MSMISLLLHEPESSQSLGEARLLIDEWLMDICEKNEVNKCCIQRKEQCKVDIYV